MTRARSAGARFVLALVLAAIGACGSEALRRPTTPRAVPAARTERQRAIDELGRRAWDALARGVPEGLLYDEVDLRVLVNPPTATRLGSLRADAPRRMAPTANTTTLLATAEYAGVCVQGARVEAEDDVLGLVADGWIFDRVLVIGRRPNGQRIAAWIEGTFLFTDVGWAALDIERVEEPRWEHSDLEIAPCDLAVRNDLPERAR